MKQKEIPAIWATVCDAAGDFSGALAGSREGLLYLSKKIEEALAKGEATIGSEADFDFAKIEVADKHPFQIPEARPLLNQLVLFFVVGFIAIVFGLAVYGAHSLYTEVVK